MFVVHETLKLIHVKYCVTWLNTMATIKYVCTCSKKLSVDTIEYKYEMLPLALLKGS